MKRALKITNGILLVLFCAAAVMNMTQENRNLAGVIGGGIWVMLAFLTYRAADAPHSAAYKWARRLNIFGVICFALTVVGAGISAMDGKAGAYIPIVFVLIVAAPFAWNLYALHKVKLAAEQEVELLPNDEPTTWGTAQEGVLASTPNDPPRSRNYFLRHWRGELSLPVSYWINGSLIGIVFLVLFLFLGEAAKEWDIRATAFTMLSALALSILITLWSIIGIMRSASEHPKRGGSAGWATAAQLFTVLGTISFAGRLATEIGPQMGEYATIAFNADSIKRVEATVAINGQSLRLHGTMGTGSVDHVKQILTVAPGVRTVVLDSIGGRMREAEMLADLVRESELDTYVEEQCLSACTYVFLAGTDRAATPNAQIGFHRPRFAGTSEFEAGLTEMLAYYRDAGISETFLTRIRNTPADDMWYPTRDELIDNGVLNRVSLGGETTSTYTQFRSRSELGLAYRSYPLLQAVEERFPGTIDKALDAAWAKVESGASDGDISSAARQIMSEIYPKLLLTADDAGLNDFLDLMIQQLSAARALGPRACGLYLQAKLDVTKVFSKELIQQELTWGMNALKAKPIARVAVAQAQIDSAIEPLLMRLPQSHLQVIAAPDKYLDQPKLRCDAMLGFYEAIAQLPAPNRLLVLRGLFQSEE